MTEKEANAMRDNEAESTDALNGAVALGHEISIEVSENGEGFFQAAATLRWLSDVAD